MTHVVRCSSSAFRISSFRLSWSALSRSSTATWRCLSRSSNALVALLLRSSQANLPPSMKASIALITCTVLKKLLLSSPHRPAAAGSGGGHLVGVGVGCVIQGGGATTRGGSPATNGGAAGGVGGGGGGGAGGWYGHGVGDSDRSFSGPSSSCNRSHGERGDGGSVRLGALGDGRGVVLWRDRDLWRGGDLCCCRRLSKS